MTDEKKIKLQELARDLYAHSMFHVGEPNPTAQLMQDASNAIDYLLNDNSCNVCCTDYKNCNRPCVPRGKEMIKDELRKIIDWT